MFRYKLQSGIPHRIRLMSNNPNGLLLKGVILVTYITDSSEHPKSNDSTNSPIAVYCDVLCYTNIAYNRWFILNKVLVSQLHGGMHDDDIWKPKATSKNVFRSFNDTDGANPGALDGDHVLIGFINNSYSEPVILKGIPHPSRDLFNEEYAIGKRLKLKAIDGNPFYIKHHGVFYGVNDSGDFIINSSFGNKGNTSENGEEDINAESGNQSFILPDTSKFSIEFNDMSNPESVSETIKLEIKKEDNNLVFSIEGENVLTVNGKGNNANLILGSGLVSPAIASKLKVLWDLSCIVFNSHIHPIIGSNTGVPTTTAPVWDTGIISQKLTFPDN